MGQPPPQDPPPVPAAYEQVRALEALPPLPLSVLRPSPPHPVLSSISFPPSFYQKSLCRGGPGRCLTPRAARALLLRAIYGLDNPPAVALLLEEEDDAPEAARAHVAAAAKRTRWRVVFRGRQGSPLTSSRGDISSAI